MYDAIIIGAGISGTALAFELSKQKGKVLLLEKENDVADGTTKANSAIMHAGYDPKTGTFMAKYNVAGNKMIQTICQDLDVPCKAIGSLVVAFCEEEKVTLQEVYERGINNGVEGMRIIESFELHQMEPNLNKQAIAALFAPSACIVNPWDLAIAYGETAVKNGVVCKLNEEVITITKEKDYFQVSTTNDTYEGNLVINAAGVNCGKVAGMISKPEYEIQPNKGEYYLLDKSQGKLVNHVIFHCPTKAGKGILVAPSVHGNLIVGPSSSNCEDDDVSTTQQALELGKQHVTLYVSKRCLHKNAKGISKSIQPMVVSFVDVKQLVKEKY